jgi:hypothetical protein
LGAIRIQGERGDVLVCIGETGNNNLLNANVKVGGRAANARDGVFLVPWLAMLVHLDHRLITSAGARVWTTTHTPVTPMRGFLMLRSF